MSLWNTRRDPLAVEVLWESGMQEPGQWKASFPGRRGHRRDRVPVLTLCIPTGGAVIQCVVSKHTHELTLQK